MTSITPVIFDFLQSKCMPHSIFNAFHYITRKRNKQCIAKTLLHQIPQMNKTSHTTVSVEIRVQICDIKVNNRSFYKLVHTVICIDKFNKIFHCIRQIITVNSHMRNLACKVLNMHAVVTITVTLKQFVLFIKKSPTVIIYSL